MLDLVRLVGNVRFFTLLRLHILKQQLQVKYFEYSENICIIKPIIHLSNHRL